MQSTKAVFEMLSPAKVCGRSKSSQNFTLVSNHSSPVTCPVTTMTHLTALSGTHRGSTVAVAKYVFLYITAIKCCCGFFLQLTRWGFILMCLHLRPPCISKSVEVFLSKSGPLWSTLFRKRFTTEGTFLFEDWAHLMEMWSCYVFIILFLVFQCIQWTVATGKFY